MNSQTFEISPQATSNGGKPIALTMGTPIVYHWLIIIVLMAMVILYPERPAWGDNLDPYLASPDVQVGWDPMATAFADGGHRACLKGTMIPERHHKSLDGMTPDGYQRPAITVMIIAPFEKDKNRFGQHHEKSLFTDRIIELSQPSSLWRAGRLHT